MKGIRTLKYLGPVITTCALVTSIDVAYAQSFPTRPLRIVCGSPGSAGDLVSRVVAQSISGPLGQQVIVDNRGNDTGEVVVKASPDGYTLLVDSSGVWLSPLMQKMSYDVVRDFAPVSMLTSSPTVLVVHPSIAANSVKELIALAKAKPGTLNYGAGGVGGSSHLASELFKAMAGGLDIVRVNYKGSSVAVTELIGGQIQMMIGNAPSVSAHIKSGKLKALAVTTLQPSALTPGLPTMAASGLPGYEYITIMSMMAPGKTSNAVIRQLNQEVVRALHRPDVKEKLFSGGSEVMGSSPEEFSAKLKSEIAKWGKLIKEAGIRVD